MNFDLNFIYLVAAAIVSVAVSFGMNKKSIENLEKRISDNEKKLSKLDNEYSKDHDILVEIKTKIDILLDEKNEKKWKELITGLMAGNGSNAAAATGIMPE